MFSEKDIDKQLLKFLILIFFSREESKTLFQRNIDVESNPQSKDQLINTLFCVETCKSFCGDHLKYEGHKRTCLRSSDSLEVESEKVSVSSPERRLCDKSKFHQTRDIAPKRSTSSETHLRRSAPVQHSSKETLQ